MSATKKSEGLRIDYTPSIAVASGDVVVIGDIVAVATEPIAANVLGAVDVEGVFTFPKATTSASAITAGAKLYWNASGEVVTTTAGTNKTAGYAVAAAGATAATVDVKLSR